jgi:isocitrate lyase
MKSALAFNKPHSNVHRIRGGDGRNWRNDNGIQAFTVEEIARRWRTKRWNGIVRPYSAAEVYHLGGSMKIEYTWAKSASEKLWRMLNERPYISALGALTGTQAIQMVEAGLGAIYVSGWQVAADANLSGSVYPDLSLYPSNSVPELVRRINRALQRADQIQHLKGQATTDWFVPIIADAEAGFGGPLNTFELTKGIIEAGGAAIHLEDQLSSEKKCGHMGGKVLAPTSQFIKKLVAARLAADVMGVDAILIARTDADEAELIANDIDPLDRRFILGERTTEGYYRMQGGIEAAIARGLACSPYADMLWFETYKPDLEEAKAFADAIHRDFPGKMLAYNCSPSFNWDKELGAAKLATFQRDIGEMGYKFQFVTLAGFHSLNHSMFELAKGFAEQGMPAYVKLQRNEFASESSGYRAVKHQSFVGAAYFDEVAQVIHGRLSTTTSLKGSTEEDQFDQTLHKIIPGATKTPSGSRSVTHRRKGMVS